ncbi:MAG: hypothetical protein LiPW41_376 [Parcubacteria group bacterium LiPW_41]|nr:MAG: hypothetical protein LiPW41_376 [Parcubacteria group bacterium LiPW_41]
MKHEPIKKLMKEGKKLFEGLGIAFSVMIAAIGFFTFLFLAASAIRTFLENRIIENAITSVQKGDKSTLGQQSIISSSTEVLLNLKRREISKSILDLEIPGLQNGKPVSSDEYSYQTFHDFFSGLGWIDSVQTTLWHDKQVSAFVLPPKFEWKRVDSASEINTEQACVRDECYSVRGLELFRKNREVPLPEEVRGRAIMTLSVAALDTQWRIAVVTKEDEEFKTWVYAFNGEEFKNLRGSGSLFSSKYIGTAGMGGNDGGWFLLYGGYEGKALQFLSDGSVVEIPNIFNTRLMDGGFVPGISKVGYGNDATWFVWSKEAGRIKFIKLFQNGKSTIDGAVDLTSSISSNIGIVRRFVCNGVVSGKSLRCNADLETVSSSWDFNDYGFDNSKPYTIVSANISNNILPVHRGNISYFGSDGSGKVTISLSNDGINWDVADNNKEIIFKNIEANRMFWKMEYTPASNPMYSVFFKSVKLDFKLKR